MDKVEVDTRLFITCRLCLEDFGLYQIVPAVKEQILYCFDIQVEPFDGKPQLICKKCEAILSDYSATKKKFIQKQEELKTKIQAPSYGQLSQAEPKTSGSSPDLANISQNIYKPRKRKACISSSSSDLECNETSKEIVVNSHENNTDRNEEIPELWPAGYKKQYVCRICSLRWVNFELMKHHIKSRHSNIKRKHKHVFKRHSSVKLHKVDEKCNITGSKNIVVHSREKIINSVDANFYIVYAIKDKIGDENVNAPHDNEEQNMNSDADDNKHYESTGSSDCGFLVKRKRKLRLCSRSSNETVVLDTENSNKAQPTSQLSEYINIDDSSDNESENGKDAAKTKTENELTTISYDNLKVDIATINDIINSSSSKYRKKYANDSFFMKYSKNPNDIATQLKRKILSIGRKMICKNKLFNCTPIIRFMEYKNLDIVWLPRPIVFQNQESNCVRIMARMKNIGENVDYETGWVTVGNATSEQRDASDSNKNANFTKVSHKEADEINVPEVSYASVPDAQLTDNALSIADANTAVTETKKLLNSNPVANPKQLPKKSPINEMKIVKVTAGKPGASKIVITSMENSDFCMPIITSTTSLAAPFTIHENNNATSDVPEITNAKNDDQKSEAPRIKVKPVSELMSKETLNRMKEPNHIPAVVDTQMHVQNENNFVNIYIPPITTVSTLQNSSQNNPIISSPASIDAPEPAWKNEYMILDTSELPNTKTNSPFEYFRRLLQLHSIILLDTDNELSVDFHCLIKFKVLYRQETNNQPVILCLALLCSNNVFCLKVKDRNQDNINLTKISPNWQWEVLKIYKGEVVNKLLNNAQKVGQDVYEYTNIFVLLLKSIKLVKM